MKNVGFALNVPTCTLATRPAAASLTNYLIFVSDAAVGQRLQVSDGAAWQPQAIDPKTTLLALSAATPDKLAWEYPGGTDVVEAWGERAAAGFAIAGVDTLNADSRSAYTVDQGSITWTGTSWTFGAGGPYNYGVRNDWGQANDQARMRAKVRLNSAGNWAGVGFKRALNDGLMFFLKGDGQVNVTYGAMDSNHSDGDLNFMAIPGGLVSLHYYWIEITRSGNNRTATIYDTDGVTVLATDTRAIPAGKQAAYGAGISMQAGAWGAYQNATVEFDQIEYITQQPESRDIWLAITPPGAARKVKRLFGSSGTAFRSDFALAGVSDATSVDHSAAGTALAVAPATIATVAAPTDGNYDVSAHAFLRMKTAVSAAYAQLFKNGVAIAKTKRVVGVDAGITPAIIELAGEPFVNGDIITLRVWTDVVDAQINYFSRALKIRQVL